MENKLLHDNGLACKVSVDGTYFRIPTTEPYNCSYYSHKFTKPGVRYEAGIGIQTDFIVWVHGPSKYGFPDILIFCSAIKGKLLKAKEQAEVDDGYAGELAVADLPKEMLCGSPRQRKRKGIVWSRHETCNKRFKQFGALKQAFRHTISRYKDVPTTISVITQITIFLSTLNSR